MYAVKLFSVVFAVAVLLAVAGLVQADSIAILNPSFESPVIAAGQVDLSTYPEDTPTPWVVGNPSRVYMTNGGAPNGSQYIEADSYQIGGFTGTYQVLGENLKADYTYTLTADVGAPWDGWYSGQGVMDLGYGSDIRTNLLTAAMSSTPNPGGGWVTWQRTFQTADSPDGLGQALRVDIGSNPGNFGIEYDNVRLDGVLTSSLPEPSTCAMLVAGLISLLAYAWRKRR
jgi:hypothetical protein